MKKAKKYNGAGIYGLYNVVDNKIYIGASCHIHSRYLQHKSNFLRNSEINPMYKEPFENFIFIIIRKMNDVEFKKYGKLLEELYMIVSKHRYIPLYNIACTGTALHTAMNTFDVYDDIDNAIFNELNVKSGHIRVRGKASRKSLCEEYHNKLEA